MNAILLADAATTPLGHMPLVALCAYLGLLLVLALYGYLKASLTEEDYYLAGRRQGFIVTTLTIMATFFSSSAMLAVPGTVYKEGVAFMIFALNLPIAGAAVYIAPLRVGGGTRLKLLQAMAMGVSIVSTSLGAEGFPVTNGVELRLADTPEDFAEAVLTLMADERARASLGDAGRTFARTAYGWDALVPRLEALYEAGLKAMPEPERQ